MISVNLKHSLLIPGAMGTMTAVVKIEGTPTLRNVIEDLIQQYGPNLRDYVIDDSTGDLSAGIAVLINGRNAKSIGGLDAKIEEGDEIFIFPPLAGG